MNRAVVVFLEIASAGSHDARAAAGTTITSAPVDGPFGRTFTSADPDGYQVTLHDRG